MSSHVSILLVPGAWHGPWAWDQVSRRLAARGFNVSVLDLASTGAEPATLGGLYDDAARFQETAARLPGTVVAVGHSYGGMVLSQGAAGLPNVGHLVYLAAFMLDAGQSVLSLFGGQIPPILSLDADARATRPVDPAALFYNGCSPESTDYAIAQLTPQSVSSFQQPLTAAAWRDVPSTYILTAQDRGIPASAQDQMAKQATHRHTLDTGHSAQLSQPGVVVELIEHTVASIKLPDRVR
jgi:pimeloyl-ACP methyl ester carboxylesterase